MNLVRLKKAAVAAAAVSMLVLGLGAKARRTYEKVYEQHTRHRVVYWDFQTALNMRATYLSPELRDAIADERQRLLLAPELDHRAFVDRLEADGDAYHEIVFSADSGMDGRQKFGSTDDGWVVRLQADGTDEPLVTVFRVKDPNPLQRALYPHFNIWSELWIARFEKTVKTPDQIVLTVASGYGHGEFTWDGLR